MLDLQRLRVLRAVAAHGSLTAAAQVLHLTTSAVSQQIAKLEREVGQPLLERQGRGIRLTNTAEVLVGHAAQILSLVEQAEAEVEAQRHAVGAGELTLAAFPTAARALVPPAVATLHRDHPQLQIRVREMDPEQSLPLMASGHLDVAVVDDWVNAPMAIPDGLHAQLLLDDVADVALHADHPLAAAPKLDIGQLENEQWISWPEGSICHDWLVHTLRSGLSIDPVVVHTAMEHSTQLALVAAGLGAAVIPRLGRGPVPSGVRMVSVRPTLTRRVHAVVRDSSAGRPAIRAVIGALSEGADETVAALPR